MNPREEFEKKYNEGFKCEVRRDVVKDMINDEDKANFDRRYLEYVTLLEGYGLDESFARTLLVLSDNYKSYNAIFNPNEIIDRLYALFNIGNNNIYRSFDYKEIFDRETYRTLLYAITNFDRSVNTEQRLKKDYPFLYNEYLKVKDRYPAINVSTFLDLRLTQYRLLIRDFDKILTYAANSKDIVTKSNCDYERLRLYVFDRFLDKLETGKGENPERRQIHILLGGDRTRGKEDDKTIVAISGEDDITYKTLLSRLKVMQMKKRKYATTTTKEEILPGSNGIPTGKPVKDTNPLSEEEYNALKALNTKKKNFYASLNPDEYLVNEKFLNNGYEAFIFDNGVIILDKVIKNDKHLRGTVGNAIYVTNIDMLSRLTKIDKKTLKSMGVKTINHTDTYQERVKEAIEKNYSDKDYTKEKIKEYKDELKEEEKKKEDESKNIL